MKIRIKLTDHGEWSDCWLQTQYIGTKDETYRIWIYPTTWSELYRSDGHTMIYHSESIMPDLLQYIKDCEEYLNTKMYDKPLTALQKISKFFSKLFTW